MKWLVVLALASFIVAGATWRRLPPEIPLWFSRPWGAAQLAPRPWVLILPASMVIVGTGAGLFAQVAAKEKLLAQMIIGGSLVIDFLLGYALVRIISLAL